MNYQTTKHKGEIFAYDKKLGRGVVWIAISKEYILFREFDMTSFQGSRTGPKKEMKVDVILNENLDIVRVYYERK